MNLAGSKTLAEWMNTYKLTQQEAAETFCLTQPAISRMLKAEEEGERTFFLIEEPRYYWRLMSVKEEHAGKLPWL